VGLLPQAPTEGLLGETARLLGLEIISFFTVAVGIPDIPVVTWQPVIIQTVFKLLP
jgi:hypothetical protein